MTGSLRRTLRPLLVAAAILTPVVSAAGPRPSEENSLTCRTAWDSTRMREEERLELIVELAYHATHAHRLGMPIGRVQGAVLGLVIEEACRQAPETPLSEAVDLAVRIAADATPSTSNTAAAF